MSSKRKVIFAPGEFYHIYNHSNSGEEIFKRKKDVDRALNLLDFYRFDQKIRFSYFDRLNITEKEQYLELPKEKLVTIYSYCLMPNHYHLLLREERRLGISEFVSNFQNSYAKFFNTKYKREGVLFRRPFKANHITGDEEFIHISRYIHLNPVTSYIFDMGELEESKITSFSSYMNESRNSFVDVDFLLRIFKTRKRYKKFVFDQVDYQRKLARIKKVLGE